MDESYAERLTKALRWAGLSKAELARRVGVKTSAIQYLCRAGKSSRHTYRIASVLGVQPEWLETGKGPMTAKAGRSSSYENVCPGPDTVRAIPVISWVQAGHWHEAIDLCHPGEAEEWRHTTKSVGERAFYLRVEGDSMMAPYGRGYPPGCLILVDPDTAPDPGRRVVARHVESLEVTFKELAYDAGQYYLKPLNPQYQMIDIDSEWEVIGVVREMIVQED